jgi:hypothetical protein
MKTHMAVNSWTIDPGDIVEAEDGTLYLVVDAYAGSLNYALVNLETNKFEDDLRPEGDTIIYWKPFKKTFSVKHVYEGSVTLTHRKS